VGAAWAFVADIIEAWEEESLSNLLTYEAGTWGGELLDQFIESKQCKWREIK
jgi:glucose-6-phosphate 1-dehydrogenase